MTEHDTELARSPERIRRLTHVLFFSIPIVDARSHALFQKFFPRWKDRRSLVLGASRSILPGSRVQPSVKTFQLFLSASLPYSLEEGQRLHNHVLLLVARTKLQRLDSGCLELNIFDVLQLTDHVSIICRFVLYFATEEVKGVTSINKLLTLVLKPLHGDAIHRWTGT